MSHKIVVLGTGGTIAGVATNPMDSVSYKAAQIGIEDLLGQLVARGVGWNDCNFQVEQVFQRDSKDLSLDDCLLLAQRVVFYLQQDNVAGVVVTHGTDTLEESAFFLANVLPRKLLTGKSVVLTCAMRPATSFISDGIQNLCDAIVVAKEAAGKGVLVVCAGVVHTAWYVQKVHTYRLDAFASVGGCPVAHVEEGRLRWMIGLAPVLLDNENLFWINQKVVDWPRVEILMHYLGADGALVRDWCAAHADSGAVPVQGMIVAGTGNGTLSEPFQAALQQAQSLGIHVLRCSRCAEGEVIAGDNASDFLPISPVSSPVKARIHLIVSLLQGQATR